MSNTLSINYKNPESKHSAREFHNGKMNENFFLHTLTDEQISVRMVWPNSKTTLSYKSCTSPLWTAIIHEETDMVALLHAQEQPHPGGLVIVFLSVIFSISLPFLSPHTLFFLFFLFLPFINIIIIIFFILNFFFH